ncbi:MAG: AraC family transcriptional regulator [Clostridia bacterium]|nr:AraC family transcriptional regulator [Clostridia bacterium]
MNWSESISRAIEYIENNLTNDITIEDIANHLYISSFYFQKGFSMLCGYSISEYIRNRKLSLAGYELLHTDNRIIDIALKYGYDSPDSFTKAFTRFHGSTPTEVRRGGKIKEFAPLKIKLMLKGGYTMEYKVVEKEAFRVVGLKDSFKYETANQEIPKIWKKFFMKNVFSKIKPKYAVNIDTNMGYDVFDYVIGDDYNSELKVPKGFEIIEIPKFTWVVFSCIGSASVRMRETNERIFKEWLPNSNDYEIAAGYNIEMYSNPKDYKKGIDDEKYYSEIWIPIKKK